MTKAEAYLDRLYHEWEVQERKLKALPEDCDTSASEVYSRYSRLAQTASVRYHAAKYMMNLMREKV